MGKQMCTSIRQKFPKWPNRPKMCQMILGPTVQWLTNAVSNCSMIGHISVQLSYNGQHCLFVEIYALFIGPIWFGKSRRRTVPKLCDPGLLLAGCRLVRVNSRTVTKAAWRPVRAVKPQLYLFWPFFALMMAS